MNPTFNPNCFLPIIDQSPRTKLRKEVYSFLPSAPFYPLPLFFPPKKRGGGFEMDIFGVGVDLWRVGLFFVVPRRRFFCLYGRTDEPDLFQ
jgi:hypothetical protein